MRLELVSATSKKRFGVAPKLFGKLLHLAQFHGWQPARLSQGLPSAEWNTEIILPYVQPYMSGSVAKVDAEALSRGLEAAIQCESNGLEQPLYFAALGVLQLAKEGEFEIQVFGEE